MTYKPTSRRDTPVSQLQRKKSTPERVSLFTGIHRRENRLKKGKQHEDKGVSSVAGRMRSSRASVTDDLTWEGMERRKHRRFRVDWRGVLVRSASSCRAVLEVHVLNVSEQGCCVHFERVFAGQDSPSLLGTEERLNLRLHVPGAILNSVVEVRWYMPVHSEIYGAGLEFISMSPSDRSRLVVAIQSLSR